MSKKDEPRALLEVITTLAQNAFVIWRLFDTEDRLGRKETSRSLPAHQAALRNMCSFSEYFVAVAVEIIGNGIENGVMESVRQWL